MLRTSKSKEIVQEWSWKTHYWQIQWHGKHAQTNGIMFSSELAKSMLNGSFILTQPQTHQRIYVIINKMGRVDEEKICAL